MLYEELRRAGLEIVAVAEDTGGPAATEPFYADAGVTYTALVDVDHTVTGLYGMVNVPTGVWIDEQGRIVRPPEAAWSERRVFGTMTVGDDRYVEALRDWVRRGAESRYVMDDNAWSRRLASRPAERHRADAHFKLAVHLHGQGARGAAQTHWERAQALDPTNWNYHRQAWAFESEAVRRERWRAKYEALKGRPYYEPLDLPPADA